MRAARLLILLILLVGCVELPPITSTPHWTATPHPTATATPADTTTPMATATATVVAPSHTPTSTPEPTATPDLDATPTPIGSVMPTPEFEATPLGGSDYPRMVDADIEYEMTRFANIRTAPRITGADVGDRQRGDVIHVRCFFEWTEGGDEWASEQACSESNQWWTAHIVSGLEYMQPLAGPLGR